MQIFLYLQLNCNKMKPTAYLFLFLLFCVHALQAQKDSCNFTISGQILDVETKAPIPFASIKVSEENKFTTTNEEGEFILEGLCSEESTLVLSCMGYTDSVSHHHHEHGRSQHFYLTQKVQKLATVLIQAERTKSTGSKSMAQNTIGKADLRKNPTQSLAAAIAQVEGASFVSTGSNVQLPIIHGLYGNRILVVNNGLKHSFQNWSKDHAPEIDVSAAHSVTVLKGAAGVRFDPEALGGAIVVESIPLYLNRPFYANVGTGFQSNGRGYNSNAKAGQGFKKWSYFLNGSYTKIGDRQSPDYILTNSGKEEQSFGFGSMYHHNNIDLKFNYSYVDQNLALLRSSVAESGNSFIRAINSDEPIIIRPFSYNINPPNQLTQHHFGKIEMSWYYSEHAKLTFRAGQQFNQRQEFDVRRNSEKPIIDLDLSTADYQLEWKHDEWFGLDGMLGLHYFSQQNRNNPGTGTTALIPNYNNNRLSAFLIEGKSFDKHSIEFGLRLDLESFDIAGRETSQALFRDQYSFRNLTASIGYIKEINAQTLFRTNVGTAWRIPNMAELYSFGQRGFKSSFGLLRYYTNDAGMLRTNRVLDVQESDVDVEKGYKWINELEINQGKDRHSITVYTHYIQQYIFERPLAVLGTIRGPMPAFIFDQADAVFVGADYSWQRSWSEKIEGTFGLSYVWSRNISKDEVLIDQPPAQLNYQLQWKLDPFWKMTGSSLSFRPLYVFKQYQAPRGLSPEQIINGSEVITVDSEIFDFYTAPKGYFLFHLAWNFEWHQLSGSIGVENLFNQRYRDYLNEMSYFADELGRNLLLSLNYSFKAQQKH